MALGIQGRHALLFDDDANAAFVNSRAALVPWNGDEALLIDRYDVRHLLDRIPPRLKRLRFVEDTGGVSRSDLDRERFLDLPLDNDDDDNNEKETSERSEAAGSGSYQAVPFSYGNSDGLADSNGSGPNQSDFHPPFPVPTSLHSNLPPTEKLHQIMARTAIFVSEHGGQSEIVLRVKQGDNPTFGFLMPDNQLHPYFRFLVEHPQLLKTESTQEEKKSDAHESGALSLLGSLYGTGEDDDDNAPPQNSNGAETGNLNYDGNSVLTRESQKEESVVSLEDKEPIKRVDTAPNKEKTILPKKNHFIKSSSIIKKGETTTTQLGSVEVSSSQLGKTDAKPLIFEPPSFLKRTIEKIVEFIHRNGKEFEAVLIEQDKSAGRFPFLLASNPFHSYYLQVLQEAYESKSPSMTSDGSKKRAKEAASNESAPKDQFQDYPSDPHRKEKFKMVIGNSKKEPNDRPSKPVRQTGVTADEAAAIVLAATRGRSPFQNTSNANSDSARASSSLHQPCKIPVSDVAVATTIAKTAALATLNEADSSEAVLTKEQKLKAERLKRAKLFAAMIKSGGDPAAKLVNSGGTPNDCVEVSIAADVNHEEREGSCVPLGTEASHREKNYRKKHHSRSKDDDEDGNSEDHKLSRKKHRKDKESRHHHHDHKHHSDDSEGNYKQEKSRHRRHRSCKHHSNSEDEERHEKSSRHSHRRHKHKHDSSEDEDRDRARKHRRKHQSPSDEIEEGEVHEKSVKHVEETISNAKPSDTTEVPSDLRAKIRAMLLENI